MKAYFLTTCEKERIPLRDSLLGATFVLLMALAQRLLEHAYGTLPAVAALRASFFPALILVAASAIYLRHRSWKAQLLFVGFFLTIIYLISFTSASIS